MLTKKTREGANENGNATRRKVSWEIGLNFPTDFADQEKNLIEKIWKISAMAFPMLILR